MIDGGKNWKMLLKVHLVRPHHTHHTRIPQLCIRGVGWDFFIFYFLFFLASWLLGFFLHSCERTTFVAAHAPRFSCCSCCFSL